MADLEFPLMDENLEIAKTNEILKDKNKTHFSTNALPVEETTPEFATEITRKPRNILKKWVGNSVTTK